MEDDDTTYVLYQEGCNRLSAGDPRGAAEVLELALEREPGQASIYETLARAYFASARVNQARWAFDEALARDPSDPYAHFGLGRCHERLGRLQAAVGHYKLACAMSPRDEYHEALARLQSRRAS